MPEGLAQTMTDQELVDLLAYLTTLKQPVSIVGQYQAIGPVHEPDGGIDLRSDLEGEPARAGERRHGPQALVAASERQRRRAGRPVAAGRRRRQERGLCLGTSVVSPRRQKARLVFDTPADIAVWLNGKPVELSGRKREQE